MAKSWVDWSDWKGYVEQPSQPLSKSLNDNGFSVKGIRQATDEELFGHLVVPAEVVKKMEEDWNNSFNRFFKEVSKIKVEDKLVKNEEWANGKSFIEQWNLSEEELKKRNSTVEDE